MRKALIFMIKRWLIYGIAFVLAFTLGLIFKGQEDSYLNVLYYPFLGLIYLFKNLSQASTTGNGFAWILLIFTASLPLIIGIIYYKKKIKAFDFLSLLFLSVSLGLVLYRSMNLNQITSWSERIMFFAPIEDIRPFIQKGLINIWLTFLLIYVIIKFFIVEISLNQKVSFVMTILMVYVILLFTYSWTQQSYLVGSHQQSLTTMENVFNIIGIILMMILIDMMIIFVRNISDANYRHNLRKLTILIKVVSLNVLIISVIKVGMLNGFQLIYLGDINDISFSFYIDIFSWILVFFFYGLYHYIVIADDVMEEVELTI